MPSLRQLQFVFVGQPLRLPSARLAGGAPALQLFHRRNFDLEAKARELLRMNDAGKIAMAVRVEWNSRLKTAAGRVDYRSKLILLNPQLIHHPGETDRTLRHELGHILAQFRAGRRRISTHGAEWRQACRDLGISGEKRCHNLPFPAKRYAARYIYRCPNCQRDFSRVRRVKRVVACLACCRAQNGGDFDPRFRLKLIRRIDSSC
jgi:SprT protein